jgi:hypothetical protein
LNPHQPCTHLGNWKNIVLGPILGWNMVTPFPNPLGRATRGRILTCVAILFAVAITAAGQIPPASKPTELLIKRYERLIESGAFLTSAGWKKTNQLFDRSYPYQRDGEIHLASTGGLIGEQWVKGNRAEVGTKWTDSYGSIDSMLRYKSSFPNQRPEPITMAYEYPLVFTNEHVDINENGQTHVTTGDWQWKLEGPQRERWATLAPAIAYVRERRNQSTDPAIRRNANKTLAILKRLKDWRCPACAC